MLRILSQTFPHRCRRLIREAKLRHYVPNVSPCPQPLVAAKGKGTVVDTQTEGKWFYSEKGCALPPPKRSPVMTSCNSRV